MNKILNSGKCTQAIQEPAVVKYSVSDALQALTNRVDVLSDVISNLQAKLYPLRVLRPTGSDNCAKTQSGSEIREWIENQSDRLDAQVDIIRHLIDEIDL